MSRQAYIDEYMAGKFRKGTPRDGPEDESDSCLVEAGDTDQDEDPMSQEEFADFKAWLDKGQPDETPRYKRPRIELSPETEPMPKEAIYLEPTSCPKCLKPSPECSFGCLKLCIFHDFYGTVAMPF